MAQLKDLIVNGNTRLVGKVAVSNTITTRYLTSPDNNSDLYVGNTGDAAWLRLSDMCARSGSGNWKVYNNGSASFKTLHVTSTGDANVAKASDAAGLKIGNLDGEHISIDGNEIIASNNGSTSTLFLNAEGGNVAVGSSLTVGGKDVSLEGHGNHIPDPQTADNATYLRNDNSWHKITPGDIGASPAHSHPYLSNSLTIGSGSKFDISSGHDHPYLSNSTNYAGSSSQGGNATKADSITTEKGTSNVTRPVFYGYSNNTSKVVYNDNFTYNPETGSLSVGKHNVANGGSVTATSFNVTSARKFKENIHPTNYIGLDTINAAEVVDYNYIADENKDPKVGLIADDCPAILAAPDRMSLDMNNCIGVLMKAVQELSEQNKELTRRIEILEEKVK